MARIQKNLLLTPNDIAKFQKLAEKAQQITIENLKKDEEYEDAPDEFIGKFLKKKSLLFHVNGFLSLEKPYSFNLLVPERKFGFHKTTYLHIRKVKEWCNILKSCFKRNYILLIRSIFK